MGAFRFFIKNRDLQPCSKIFNPVLHGQINFQTRRARCLNKSAGQRRNTMENLNTVTKKNGGLKHTVEIKQDRKPVVVPTPAKLEPVTEKSLSIDQKIQKVQDLNDLIAKRNRFLEAKTKLNSFNLKREETSTRITVQDNAGNQFLTSQSEAIEKILGVLKESINKGLAETESKIQF